MGTCCNWDYSASYCVKILNVEITSHVKLKTLCGKWNIFNMTRYYYNSESITYTNACVPMWGTNLRFLNFWGVWCKKVFLEQPYTVYKLLHAVSLFLSLLHNLHYELQQTTWSEFCFIFGFLQGATKQVGWEVSLSCCCNHGPRYEAERKRKDLLCYLKHC